MNKSYVIGMKSYDCNQNLIKNSYTFIDGPYQNIEDAEKDASSVIERLSQKYAESFPAYVEFDVIKEDNEYTLCQLSNNLIPIFSLDVIKINLDTRTIIKDKLIDASVKGATSRKASIIEKRLRRKACQILSGFAPSPCKIKKVG